jgi:hypothetical protein
MARTVKRINISNLRMVLFSILMVFLSHTKLSAQYNENVIKAAYIERITRFIEWPAKDNPVSANQFVIGVYEEDEFFNALSEVFKDKTIKELKVKIVSVRSPKQVSSCNICYISEDARPNLNEFIEKANANAVLLISGTSGFCSAGVHINFYLEDEKLKFEINEATMASAGFKVSYLLKQNTRIIK